MNLPKGRAWRAGSDGATQTETDSSSPSEFVPSSETLLPYSWPHCSCASGTLISPAKEAGAVATVYKSGQVFASVGFNVCDAGSTD